MGPRPAILLWQAPRRSCFVPPPSLSSPPPPTFVETWYSLQPASLFRLFSTWVTALPADASSVLFPSPSPLLPSLKVPCNHSRTAGVIFRPDAVPPPPVISPILWLQSDLFLSASSDQPIKIESFRSRTFGFFFITGLRDGWRWYSVGS